MLKVWTPCSDPLASIKMFVWDIDPVLVDFGSLEIRYYGILFSLSLFLAYLLARHMASKRGLSLVLLDSLVIYLVLGVIIGTRLGHILFYRLDYFLAHPVDIFKVWEGGLSSHGGAIGTLVAYLLFTWRHRKEVGLFDYGDIIVIVACIPTALIRLGNFMNSEIVGRPSDLPWAVVFPRYDEIARHPSQLYEFGIGLLLLAILYPLWRAKYRTASPGFFFGLFFMLYFAARFFVEFFKEYPLHENFLNLTTGQILSVPFFVFGLVILLLSRIKPPAR